ncbi:MAG: dipeptide ABC transporter ATP-binding protein [Clostridia bacterium]|nr:dipeptide ABC transporter ATP-binding protein [Clostridia bacterium]MBQ3479337.1 dipeptide ABC transporter ATP-binding protein [Clostridia bacterium]MBQ6123377.1 dipeptide ABC transporter ATP-binding protein [Clostridia bacterium]
MSQAPLFEARHIVKNFQVGGGLFNRGRVVHAVDDVSFIINKGETFGLVGESGCGKSTIGRTILRLHEPTSGQILLDGEDITHVNMRPYRKRMQIVFQDPYASLDPRMTVGDIVGEPLDIQEVCSGKAERQERILELLNLVGLNSEHMNRYPHEFSGGQRQRVSIARAMALHPDFMVCDEPISALDVSIQAQVINMLMDLQQKLGMAYLFIAHDLNVVRHISKNVGVMYLGSLVEVCESDNLYLRPMHPYTQALLSAIPIPDPEVSRSRQRVVLEGDVPSPIDPPKGCKFHTRCPYAMDICRQQRPETVTVEPGHICACHKVARELGK